MADNRYQVFYTGKTHSYLDIGTIRSNLVLSLNITDEKAERLLKGGEKLLKRCDTIAEARILAEKFEKAGVICVVRDASAVPESANLESTGESSSLVRLLKSFRPGAAKGDNPSLVARLGAAISRK